jgi:hypothetical protein
LDTKPYTGQLHPFHPQLPSRHSRERGLLIHSPPLTSNFIDSPICLHVNRLHIHANIKSTLLDLSAVQPLQQYLQQKNRWTSNQFHSINWHAHHSALIKHKQHNTALIKLIHNWAPLGALQQQLQLDTFSCPTCLHHKEDEAHFFTCNSHHIPSHIQTFKKSLRQCHTAPAIIDHFLTAFLHPNRNPPSLNKTKFEISLKTSITLQKQLGPLQICKGRIVKHWEHTQSIYQSSLNYACHSSTWSNIVTSHLLQLTHSLWTHRNSRLHLSSNNNPSSRLQSLQVDASRLYNRGPAQLLPGDRGLLHRPLASLLTLPANAIAAWISQIHAAIAACTTIRQTQEHNQPRITSFYKRRLAHLTS